MNLRCSCTLRAESLSPRGVGASRRVNGTACPCILAGSAALHVAGEAT